MRQGQSIQELMTGKLKNLGRLKGRRVPALHATYALSSDQARQTRIIRFQEPLLRSIRQRCQADLLSPVWA